MVSAVYVVYIAPHVYAQICRVDRTCGFGDQRRVSCVAVLAMLTEFRECVEEFWGLIGQIHAPCVPGF